MTQASREMRVITLMGRRVLLGKPSGFKGKGTPVHFSPSQSNYLRTWGFWYHRGGHRTTLALFLLMYRMTGPGLGHCKIPCCISILRLNNYGSCPDNALLREWLPFEVLTWSHTVRKPQRHLSLQAKCIYTDDMTEPLRSCPLCDSEKGERAVHDLEWKGATVDPTEQECSKAPPRGGSCLLQLRQMEAGS